MYVRPFAGESMKGSYIEKYGNCHGREAPRNVLDGKRATTTLKVGLRGAEWGQAHASLMVGSPRSAETRRSPSNNRIDSGIRFRRWSGHVCREPASLRRAVWSDRLRRVTDWQWRRLLQTKCLGIAQAAGTASMRTRSQERITASAAT